MKPQDRTRAILLSRVETPHKMVLVVLADAMMEDRETCWLKVETVATRSGYCERQARDILGDLEARGILRRWRGEHTAPDMAIEWDALAAAEERPSTRGGARTKGVKTAASPAKIAPPPAKTAEVEGCKDCTPDLQRLHPDPAKIASQTCNDCPRSGKEADLEAGREAGSPQTPEPECVRTPHPGSGPRPQALSRPGMTEHAEAPPSPAAPPTPAETPPDPPIAIPGGAERGDGASAPELAADLDALWSALVAFTPKPSAWRLTPQRRTHLRQRIADHDAASVERVAEWVRTSTHDRARFLRERGDPDTLLRREKFDTYAAMSAGPALALVHSRAPPTSDSPRPSKAMQSSLILARIAAAATPPREN